MGRRILFCSWLVAVPMVVLITVMTLLLAAVSYAQDTGENRNQKEMADTDQPERKARVAVMPAAYVTRVRTAWFREMAETFGLPDPTAIENVDLTRHLVNALVNSRKFEVLEREKLISVARELDFAECDYASAVKSIKMGRMLGADYVILPEIDFIHVIVESKRVPFVPVRRTEYKGKIATRLRVVESETGRIVASSIRESEYRETMKRDEEFVASFALSFLNSFFGAVAMELTSNMIDIVYPIKIVAIRDSVVTLNRGKGAIQVGEVLTVYEPGELVEDPDTGDILGFQEEAVGRIKVFAVRAKMCEAHVVQGRDRIKELYVCRRAREIETVKEPPAPRID